MVDDLLQAWQEFLRDGALGFVMAAWGFFESAFDFTDIRNSDNEGLWMAVVGGEIRYETPDGDEIETIDHPGMLNIVVIAMIPILMIFIGLQLITSIVRSSSAGFLRACMMAVLSIPSIYVLTGLMWSALAATSRLTQWILTAGTGDDEVSDGTRAIMSMFGIRFVGPDDDYPDEVVADAASGMILDESSIIWSQAGLTDAPGRALIALGVAGLIALCALLLLLMMMFRLVAVLLLTVFMPVGVFALSFEGSKAVFTRWISIVIALLLAEPVAAVVIRFGSAIAVFGTDWVRIAMGVILMLCAAVTPLLMMSLASFMTGGASDSIERGAVATAGAAYMKAKAGKAMVGRPAKRITGGATRAATAPIRQAQRGAKTVKPSTAGRVTS